jgi:hypothetical protein
MPRTLPVHTHKHTHTRYTQTHGVQDHFENQPGPFQMVDVTRHTYECVDARGSGPMLGTPGGDLAELMACSMAVMKLT